MAERFITWAAGNLQRSPERLDRLHRERGITPATAERWRLGWNPEPLKRPGKPWGLPDELAFPAGLVIPTMRDGTPVAVNIRRVSGEPKYHRVKGSRMFPYLLPGDVRGTVVLLESELDGLLLWETARDVVFPVPLGGCIQKPDMETMELITGARVLLNCMDNDPAGGAAGAWWQDWFPQYCRWKPTQKDPGEMFKAGESVRRWLLDGLRAKLRELGIWAGKLDFYNAVDRLAEPFPTEMLQTLTEEQIERAAIIAENSSSFFR